MLRNKKGMTLVEMIVSIAIIAIATLILATGFSTVIRHMGEAGLVKNAGNDAFEKLETASEEVTNSETKVNISLSNGDQINETINMVLAKEKVDENYTVSFKRFTRDTGPTDIVKDYYTKLTKGLDYFLSLSDKARLDVYREKRKELIAQGKSEIKDYPEYVKPDGTDQNIWYSNDNLRNFFFIVDWGGQLYPKVASSIIQQCNELFDRRNPNFPNSNMRFGDKDVYMKPYLMPKTKKYLLYGVVDGKTANATQGSWRARLIYNPDDENWYYKNFMLPANGLENEDSYYLMSKFTNDDIALWMELSGAMQAENGWTKILSK